MRSILLGSLLLNTGLSVALAQTSGPLPARVAPVPPSGALVRPRPEANLPTWRVETDFQVSIEDARRVVLHEGQRLAEQYLRGRGLTHLNCINDKNFEVRCQIDNWRQEDKDFGGNIGKMYRATCDLSLPNDVVQECLHAEHTARANERMLWLFKLVGGVFALLGIGVGYLRLEEATKGYHTYLLSLVFGGAGLTILGLMAYALHIS